MELNKLLQDKSNYYVYVITLILFSLIYAAYSHLKNRIVNEQTSILSSLEPGYSLIKSQTDENKQVNFQFVYDHYKFIRSILPEASAVISLELEIFIHTSNRMLKKPVNAIFVDENFFKFMKGNLIYGRFFNSKDIDLNSNTAIITPLLAKSLFGNELTIYPIIVQNIPLQILGSWDFNNDFLEENNSLILPISKITQFKDYEKIRFTSFVLKGDDSNSVKKLKDAMEKAQNALGLIPVRPTLKIQSLQLNYQDRMLWKIKFLPLDDMFAILALVFLIISYFVFDKCFSLAPEYGLSLLLEEGSQYKATLRFSRELITFILKWFCFSYLLYVSLLTFFGEYNLKELSYAYPSWHGGIIMLLLVPIMISLLFHYKLIYKLNWKKWL